VGNQHLGIAGERHGDHRALAHAAGELMRIFLGALLRLGNADETQHLDRLRHRGRVGEILMQPQRLADLPPDSQHWIERRHRLLEDHRDLVAAHIAHRRFVEHEEVAPVEPDASADDAAGRIGNETHQRQRRHALAAAAFTDHRQGLAAVERERDVVDGAEQALPGEEHGLQPFDLEHGRCSGRAHQLRSRGSRMSRSASPSRLVPKTARLMAMPGKITSQGAVRTYSAADSDSMRPQEGCGSGTPRPRKESDASVRMAEPSWAVASTMSGASVLGRTWRSAMRSSLMPTARAASTKGNSRSARVLARMTRAICGMSGMAMAIMVLRSDGPSEAAITSASTKSGSA